MTHHRPPATDPRFPAPDFRSPTPDPRPPLVAYIDGGARGNPGPAGYGVRFVTPEGAVLDELHEAIGIATNNIAEYRGLLAALAYAIDRGHDAVHVRSDSELLVRQMRGEYRVKHPGLQPLHQQARRLMARLKQVTFEHVPRAKNAAADRLANQAMDEAAAQAKPPP
jgi:ribonuclease HI